MSRGGNVDRRPDRRTWSLIRYQVLVRDGWRCRLCGSIADCPEVDHIKPVDAGGTHALDNLRTVCRGCHIDHHRKPPPDVAAWRAHVRRVHSRT